MHLSALLQFAVSTDCPIREYQSIFVELSSIVLKYPPNMLEVCWNSNPAFIMLPYLMQAYSLHNAPHKKTFVTRSQAEIHLTTSPLNVYWIIFHGSQCLVQKCMTTCSFVTQLNIWKAANFQLRIERQPYHLINDHLIPGTIRFGTQIRVI